jgi:serine protease AprX
MPNSLPVCILRCALAGGLLAAATEAQDPIRLVYQTFVPSQFTPDVADRFRSPVDGRLWIVQFAGVPRQSGRDRVIALGAEICSYLPDNAYLVRMPGDVADSMAALAEVAWVGPYHPAYRLEPALLAALRGGEELQPARYQLVMVDKREDKPAVAAAVTEMGGRVDSMEPGSILMTVTLDGEQLVRVARLDGVQWIDRWSAPEDDMDNVRIQGGANYIEQQGGYTGSGVNAHVYEGVEQGHADFAGGVTNVLSGGNPQSHGHATAGIVWGNGNSNPLVRGMAPDCGKFFTEYQSVSTSRWAVVDELVNNLGVSHTTASWGAARTVSYTSLSADTDDIIFDHDIPWTQSQSNAGNRNSRPQAWAKNVISVGAVQHFDNSNPADDSWAAGNASIGPAPDGRIKPDLCAYFDQIGTSDRTGAAGYSPNDWYSGFNGTSGATPIIAGHDVLAIQLFTDGIFGNALRNPNGTRHENRPHFTTLKAMMIASAQQYPFNSTSNDNLREHQGWGFPDLARLYDSRGKALLVDESDVLRQGQVSRWDVTVAAGEPDLRVCMTFAEPAANPAAAQQTINDLTLRVTAPNGNVFWGNEGLDVGVWSTAGGSADVIDPVECVFVTNPMAGVWHVDVLATRVVVDNHLETTAVDADYGLAVFGGQGQAGVPPAVPFFDIYGQGCAGSFTEQPVCISANAEGRQLAGISVAAEVAYAVPNPATVQVSRFEIYSASTSATPVTVGAFLYADNNGQPGQNPVAQTSVTIDPVAGFHAATFSPPVTMTGPFYVAVDHSAQGSLTAELAAGQPGSAFERPNPLIGSWSPSASVSAPIWRVVCSPAVATSPMLTGVGQPRINATYDVVLSRVPAFTIALQVMGFSDAAFPGGSLPFQIPGAPGCNLLVSPDSTLLFFTSFNREAVFTVPVPNIPGLVGLDLLHQWAVLDNVNSLGLTTSNAGRASIAS